MQMLANKQQGIINTYKGFSSFDFYKNLKLDEELEQLIQLEDLNSNHKFKIAVVGEFNTGKSTLINSLIGKNILPTGILPTTNQVVTLENTDEQESIKKSNEIYPLNDENIKVSNKYGSNFEIKAHFEQMKNFIFLDTAGTNDYTKLSDEIVFDLIGEVDIVLFIMDSMQVLSESEFKFLSKLIRKKDINKFLFVINKVDLKSDEEKIELVEHIIDKLSAKEDLIEQNILKNQIFLYSAINAIEDIENSKKLVDNINKFTLNKYDSLKQETILRQISNILQNSFIKLNVLLETLNGQNKEYEENLKQIDEEIEKFKNTIKENIETFEKDFIQSKHNFISNVKQSFINIKTILKEEILSMSTKELSEQRYIEIRARKLIEDYITENSNTFFEELNNNFTSFNTNTKYIFKETQLVINNLSTNTKSSYVVKGIAIAVTGALAISYAPVVLTVSGVGATLFAGLTVASIKFPLLLPFVAMFSTFAVTLGQTLLSVGKMAFNAGSWGVNKVSSFAEKAELEIVKKQYISSIDKVLETLENQIVRDIRNTHQAKDYLETFIKDKFPQKKELEDKIKLSQENISFEINKIDDEKEKIVAFIENCNNIIKKENI
ncbi:dynamin family protein [Aliarcobacter butzleri]|uniref:Dynamin family protein n=1 Tax=Aliarcobacter butzleri TaxID=28197 RepID=A0AAW7PQJ2_9BACT|nr:dynamin family protein [Aliarcobacter butzleri]MDN5063413.1 dynamin family protein [Aliarcobacter butzleri]MDN5065791.1 dynamin family protein [Aliarcobacter butzleri]